MTDVTNWVSMSAGKAGDRITIRQARRDDVASVVDLFAGDDLGGHGDSADPAFLPDYLDAFDSIVSSISETLYVSEWDGVLAGTFQIAVLRTLTGRGSASLLVQAVHVRADLRGNGIGHAMMLYCIDLARQRGAKSVKLMSNALRVDAHRFYEGLGFVRSHAGFTMSVKQ